MPSFNGFRAALVAAFGIAFSLSLDASALTLQVPAGGASFPLPDDRILCGAVPEGWTTDSTRRHLRPPADKRPGTSVAVVLGAAASACSANKAEQATLLITGALPTIDAASVSLFVDAARLELHGEGLEGTRIGWKSGDKAGSDVCLNVVKDKGRDFCTIGVDKNLPGDPRATSVWWAPAGGRSDPDVVTFDQAGNPVAEDQRRLTVARLVLNELFPRTRTVDVASGEGRVELVHPESVSSAECGAAHCELTAHSVSVRAVPAGQNNVAVKLRLAPRVFLARGDALDATPTESLAVLRCPMTVVSGRPLRNVDDLKVVVRFDRDCGRDVERLRWSANREFAEVVRTEHLQDGRYVLLRVGRVTSEKLAITAAREEDGGVVAAATEQTQDPPVLQTSLVFKDFGTIDFIPKNRDAMLTIAPITDGAVLVPISVPGAYAVTELKDGYHVRGVYTSGGYAALRFAYRVPSLPEAIHDTDLAVLVDPVQHPIREASVPAPLGTSSISKRPIIELRCSFGKDGVRSIPSGTAPHVPFSERDSCHVIIHRDRIPAESGEQRIDIDVSVSNVNGNDRSEAKLSEHLVVRHGPGNDVIWIRGAKEQFDKISIRVTQVIDETQYAGRSNRLDLPSAQWTVVTENARFRFYATAAIPTSLYRFSNDPQDLGTGPLALNFGVLSRLTWLDSDGHEALIGLEAGVMGMGLATEKDRQLAAVAGFGISIPLGNANQPTQASVNIHFWGAYTIGERQGALTNDAGQVTGHVTLSPWAFVFGPSITIGNVGTFL